MKKLRTPLIYLAIIVVIVLLVMGGQGLNRKQPERIEFGALTTLIRSGMLDENGQPRTDEAGKPAQNSKIYAVRIEEETLYGIYTLDYYNSIEGNTALADKEFEDKIKNFNSGRSYDFYTTVSDFEYFRDEMRSLVCSVYGMDEKTVTSEDYGFIYSQAPTPQVSWFWMIFPYLLLAGSVLLVFMLIMRSQNRENRQAMSFGKSRHRVSDGKDKKTFDDVQGCDEEKEELQEIVDFLKNPDSYTKMGARIPKGMLLVGPPGTGKTLLAKAVAGEAGVPFLSISGSDFVEMFVGVGASRVRDLFQTAKRNAPSLVFIDEIDAVGRKRGAGLGGGHDEKEQTLNQLLVEMDGFEGNQGVIVIAATNRPDVLDPALLRPGRFDRQITVDYPDVKGREAILRLYAKTKPMSSEVDLNKIAKLTPGMTGADLENVMNEAAILATRRKLPEITTDLIAEAMKRVSWGPEKKSRIVTEEDKFNTATHEVGHAIVSRMLPHCDPIDELSIIQRGRALGYTSYIPQDDRKSLTRGKMLDEIACFMGGRMAEAVRLSDISTGAQNDLKRATELAKRMVTEFGMSENIGPVYLAGDEEVFIGKEWGHQPNYSEAVSADIDREVRRIMEEACDRARKIIEENDAAMTRIIAALVEHEHVSGTEFDRLLAGETDWQDKPENESAEDGSAAANEAHPNEAAADRAPESGAADVPANEASGEEAEIGNKEN